MNFPEKNIILETKNLTKFFGSRKALDNVSLSLREGGVYGLLGPNGAGKTTFLRLVNNVLARDSGDILYRGEPLDRKSGCHLGYMAEERGLYAKMSVEDEIIFFGRLRGGNPLRLREVMREYMDIFEMSDSDRKRQVKELSKGNQQKVQIIATLVHEPDLVMLDEPFSGFDPINGALLNQVIERLRNAGATIVLSSHNMPAVEEICSSIALINHGRLLLSGPIEAIKQRFREHRFEVKTSSPVDFKTLQEDNIIQSAILRPHEACAPYTYELRMTADGLNNNLATEICRQSTLLGFTELLPSLNELFIRFASGEEEPVHMLETANQQDVVTNFEKLN